MDGGGRRPGFVPPGELGVWVIEDRNEAIFLAAELGLPELRFANMVWMPGGGGGCAAVANAAICI